MCTHLSFDDSEQKSLFSVFSRNSEVYWSYTKALGSKISGSLNSTLCCWSEIEGCEKFPFFRQLHSLTGQDVLCVWITLERTHPEEKASLVYTRSALCHAPMTLHGQETIKLSKLLWFPPVPRRCSKRGCKLWTRLCFALTAEVSQCHQGTAVPAAVCNRVKQILPAHESSPRNSHKVSNTCVSQQAVPEMLRKQHRVKEWLLEMLRGYRLPWSQVLLQALCSSGEASCYP